MYWTLLYEFKVLLELRLIRARFHVDTLLMPGICSVARVTGRNEQLFVRADA